MIYKITKNEKVKNYLTYNKIRRPKIRIKVLNWIKEQLILTTTLEPCSLKYSSIWNLIENSCPLILPLQNPVEFPDKFIV